MSKQVTKRVLVISLQGLGNTVILSPILKYLDKLNSSKISLCLSNNGSDQYVTALGLRAIENRYVWDEKRSSVYNLVCLARQLRKDEFDIAYAGFPAGKRENAVLFLSRAKGKAILRFQKGYFKLWEFLNPAAKLADQALHDFENNALLFQVPASEIQRKQFQANLFRELVVGLHVGSKALSKRWDVDKYAGLMQMLRDFFGCRFVVIAGKDEENLVDAIRKRVKWDFDAIVGLEFGKLIRRLGSLSLLVGNDSSIGHIASILGIPTVVIWAYAQFSRVSPYGHGSIVIKKDYDCIPCYDFTKHYIDDCKYHLRCIKDVSVAEVFEIIRRSIQALQQNRVPSEQDFMNLGCVAEVERLTHGCIVVSTRSAS